MTTLRVALLASLLLPLGTAAQDTPPPAVDQYGDALPRHGVARLGTVRFRQGSRVAALRYSADGKRLMSSGDDQALRVWEAKSGKEVFSFNHPKMQLTRRQGGQWLLSPDGKVLAVFDRNQVNLIDVSTGQTRHTLRDAHQDGFAPVMSISPDGKYLATVGKEKKDGQDIAVVRLTEMATGKQYKVLEGPKPKEESSLRSRPANCMFSPDGKFVVATGDVGRRGETIQLWEVENGKLLPALANPGQVNDKDMLDSDFELPGFIHGLSGLPVFSPDGKTMVAGIETGRRNAVKLCAWDPVTGKHIRDLGEDANGYSYLLFAPDNKTLAVLHEDQTLQLLDVSTGKELKRPEGSSGNDIGMVFSPDGKILAVGTEDQTIRLCDVASGKELHQLKGFQGTFRQLKYSEGPHGLGTSIVFSRDGKTIAAAGGSLIRQWDVATGTELNPPEGSQGTVHGVAASPDGKVVVTISGDQTVRLWDAANGKELRQLEVPPLTAQAEEQEIGAHNAASASGVNLAFSANAKVLAAGWPDGSVILWDTPSGKPMHRMKGHDFGVPSLAFMPNGKSLVTGGMDGRVLWWDVASGKQTRRFDGHAAGALGSVTAPDSWAVEPGQTVALWPGALRPRW